MKSHIYNQYRIVFIGGASSSPSRCRQVFTSFTTTVLLFLFVVSTPSFVLAFKAGHVEPVAGSSFPRKVPSPSAPSAVSGNSKNPMLMKLSSTRGTMPLFYETSKPTVFSHTGQARDASLLYESDEHEPFVKFPTIPSPFGRSSETHPHHPHLSSGSSDQDYHHFEPSSPPRLKSAKPEQSPPPLSSSKASLQAREEPSSLFTPEEDEFESYYTTGSDATMSGIDIDRYSQETDLYEKQSATPIQTAPSVAANKKGNDNDASSTRSSSGGKSNTNHNNGSNGALSKPTLLPANYLSLAAFRQIDGTLERSSSNIISRIANFWRNMNNRNNNSNATSSYRPDTTGSGTSSTSAINKSNSSNSSSPKTDVKVVAGDDGEDDTKAPLKLTSDAAGHIDNIERGGNVVLKNVSSASDRARGQQSESLAQRGGGGGGSVGEPQPSKFISVEDSNQSGLTSGKHHYLSLDDAEEDISGGGDGNNAHNENASRSGKNSNQEDHHHHHHDDESHHDLQHHASVEEDASEISADTFHDDLFHTAGTITATFKDDDEPRSTKHQDLIGSGSNARDQPQVVKASSNATPPMTKGEVRKAESDKIWSIDSHFGREELVESAEEDHEYYGMTIGGFLKRELWTIPLFVLAALNMILVILFEVYVLCRARGQSRRHLFLGQMLLFGLFLCSFLALMFAVHPSIVGCFVGRLGVGFTYSLIFSVLLVKCVFLLSLDTGVYLPTSYQGILLFFTVLVQVAIDTQWVIIYPPFLQTVESGRSILLQCGTSFVQLLYSLSYVAFLVLVVGFLAGRAAYKGVVENYKESVYILITAVVTVPVALSWTVAGWMLQGRHQDACVSFGLVAHSLTTFLIMFMPKGRQLASLDKEGVCFEDQEDQCSGYSPSFFHFKPTTKNYKTALWGDGNLYTTLEPTVSTINPNVFFHRNDFHSGMIY